jgi:hypothetical protein
MGGFVVFIVAAVGRSRELATLERESGWLGVLIGWAVHQRLKLKVE